MKHVPLLLQTRPRHLEADMVGYYQYGSSPLAILLIQLHERFSVCLLTGKIINALIVEQIISRQHCISIREIHIDPWSYRGVIVDQCVFQVIENNTGMILQNKIMMISLTLILTINSIREWILEKLVSTTSILYCSCHWPCQRTKNTPYINKYQ